MNGESFMLWGSIYLLLLQNPLSTLPLLTKRFPIPRRNEAETLQIVFVTMYAQCNPRRHRVPRAKHGRVCRKWRAIVFSLEIQARSPIWSQLWHSQLLGVHVEMKYSSLYTAHDKKQRLNTGVSFFPKEGLNPTRQHVVETERCLSKTEVVSSPYIKLRKQNKNLPAKNEVSQAMDGDFPSEYQKHMSLRRGFEKTWTCWCSAFPLNAEHLQFPASRGLEPSQKGVKAGRMVTPYDESRYCLDKKMNFFKNLIFNHFLFTN